MYVVAFEVYPKTQGKAKYQELASGIRAFLENQEGFISIERFQSLTDEGKMLSLSYWESEDAIKKWRNLEAHRHSQQVGRDELFHSYSIRVFEVVRDYTESDRDQAPPDSNAALK